MTVYICLAFVILISALFTNKKKYVVFIGVIFVMVAALRGVDVGTDLSSYYSAFNRYSQLSFSTLSTIRYEPLYGAVNILVNILGGDFRTLLIVVAIITMIGPIVFVNKHSKLKWFSLMLFYLFGCYINSLNMMRMYIAISLYIVGLCFYLNGNRKVALICTGISVLFHYTAIVGFVFYALEIINKQYKKVFFSILVMFITFALRNEIIRFASDSYVRAYSGGTGLQIAGNGLALVFVYGVFLLLGLLIQKRRASDKYIRCYISLIISALVFQLLATSISTITRMTYYFITPALLIMPNIIFSTTSPINAEASENASRFIHSKNNYAWLLLVLLVFVIWFIRFPIMVDSNGVIPYSFLN